MALARAKREPDTLQSTYAFDMPLHPHGDVLTEDATGCILFCVK